MHVTTATPSGSLGSEIATYAPILCVLSLLTAVPHQQPVHNIYEFTLAVSTYAPVGSRSHTCTVYYVLWPLYFHAPYKNTITSPYYS